MFSIVLIKNHSIVHNFKTTCPIQVGFSTKYTSTIEHFNQTENWKCHRFDFRLIFQDRITFYHLSGLRVILSLKKKKKIWSSSKRLKIRLNGQKYLKPGWKQIKLCKERKKKKKPTTTTGNQFLYDYSQVCIYWTNQKWCEKA